MKRLRVDFIPQEDQRIPGQVGDYFDTHDAVVFRISETGNPLFNLAILLHEIWEWHRTQEAGIPISAIDEFDRTHPELDDPGFNPRAPYHKEHCEADAIERVAVALGGRTWSDYEEAVNALFV